MKKINFKKITVADLDGNKNVLNISKEFGNYLYQNTIDLGMLEVAQIIYKTGEIELNEENKEGILKVLKHPGCVFIAVIKKQLIDELEKNE